MAIKKRITDEFDVIFIYDSALDALPNEMVQKWIAKGRNNEDLDLSQCIEKPTVFRCRPFRTKYEHLKGDVKNGDPLSCWATFAFHVIGAKDCTDSAGKDLIKWEGDAEKTIKESCREDIPMDVYIDVAQVICGKAEEASAFFTVPDTFWGTRARSQMLRVKDVRQKDAETISE